MNYLDWIDRRHRQHGAGPFLFSGCDESLRNHLLQHIIQAAARDKKALVVLDNGNLLPVPAVQAAGYRVINGLGGEFALCDPFRVDTLPGMLQFRNLLGSLGYSETQKQALVQYLDFLSYVEGLSLSEGKPHITLEVFGRYSTVAQTEARLLELRRQGVISHQQQLHLLSKYAELSADAADFEKFLYLLLLFIRGEPLALDTEGVAVVYPLAGLDGDSVFCSLLTCLLSWRLNAYPRDKVTVVILDRGSGRRDYLTDFVGQLSDMDHYLLSDDIFTLCSGAALTSLKNRFAIKLYSRHADMDSCAAVEKGLGCVQMVKQSKAVQYDRRWRANSPWDILLANNRTDITTSNAPVWEARYPKEMIHSLASGSAILEAGGNITIVTI